MAIYFRKRSRIHIPITLSVSLMALNVTLMVCWILLLASSSSWGYLTVGVITFTLILAGLSLWLVLSIKEIRLNHRQANFVDSVTHELKSPIAALKLYLETLRMRSLSEEKQREFHEVMAQELERLDQLINQLLEVGRLDAVGAHQDPESIALRPLLVQCARSACLHHGQDLDSCVTFDVPPLSLHARQMVLQLIFSNLIDNAVKYGGDPPEVHVRVATWGQDRVRVWITSGGLGVAYEDRGKIFKIFYRGGDELERRRKGTGLGLYIVHTLVKRLKGKVTVYDRPDGSEGCVFEVELPGLVQRGPAASPGEAEPATTEEEEVPA